MSEYICYLVTLIQYFDGRYSPLEVAVRVKATDENAEIFKFYHEEENAKRIEDKLPIHCKGYPILTVKSIFEIAGL